jgi:hypothetical protein
MTTETQLLQRIADIAHAGGLKGMSVESAQNEIRRLTIPYWQAALSHPTAAEQGAQAALNAADADQMDRYAEKFGAAEQPQAPEHGAVEVVYVDPSMLREVLAGNQRFVAMSTSPDKWATQPVTLSATPPAPKLEPMTDEQARQMAIGAPQEPT